jgi:hypothetical protein
LSDDVQRWDIVVLAEVVMALLQSELAPASPIHRYQRLTSHAVKYTCHKAQNGLPPSSKSFSSAFNRQIAKTDFQIASESAPDPVK